VIARLWSGESVTFDGTHYHDEAARIAPLPVQRPLPLWIGGSSKAAIRRTAQIGTGWLGGGQTVAQVAPTVEAIRQASAAAGRPLDPDHYGIGFAFRFGAWDDEPSRRGVAALARLGPDVDPKDHLAVGDATTILGRIQEFRAAGISKFVLRPLAAGDGDVLDQTRRLISEVLPIVHG
jgi:alkanesulfonate monooxygenase SsuD/methylene tetrahydromethanopterin reductase-like flavin-dependent oxidoreductase (luciferase family)